MSRATSRASQGNGSTTARGYGYQHQQLRAALLPYAYGQPCHHCGTTMLPGQTLDLDHTDDRTGYRGMAHATCNRRMAGIKSGQMRRTQVSRRW